MDGLLQLQLATDSSAVVQLPYVLQTLNTHTFASSQSQKWTTRINSLIHSKDSAARWSGLSIALRTAALCKPIMIECAQSWIGVALPMLSKNEPSPCLKAAIRLVRHIFSNAADVPEFQRQVVTPNITKFSQALALLLEKEHDEDLKILCLKSLSQLIPIYPSAHRALHASLSTITLKLLDGSTPKPSCKIVVENAAQLYSILPLTGGKVGASPLWRKSIDETIEFTWNAFYGLRFTFPQDRATNAQNTGDPMLTIPLNLDRLYCGIIALTYLIRTNTPRPVQFPVGSLTKLCMALLSCNGEEKIEGHVDQSVREMELSAIPTINSLGCDFVECLVKCAKYHLTPQVTRLLSCITFQLEESQTPKLPFLRVIPTVLSYSHPLANPIVSNRLTKAVLPCLVNLLSSESDVKAQDDPNGSTSSRKKGKKRARGYEGDEVFKTRKEVFCQAAEDDEIAIAAVQAIQALLRDPGMTPAVQSVASRVMLSLHVTLPRISPSSLSNNLTLHSRLLAKVQELCLDVGCGNSSVMSRSLPIISATSLKNDDTHRRLDLLLHPRLPPLVRSMPQTEALNLFRSEENQEEIDLRKQLGLGDHEDEPTTAETSESLPHESFVPVPEKSNQLKLASYEPTPQPNGWSKPQASLPIWQPQASPVTNPAILAQVATTIAVPPVRIEPPAPAPANPMANSRAVAPPVDDDEDEEMPAIDMDSDSD